MNGNRLVKTALVVSFVVLASFLTLTLTFSLVAPLTLFPLPPFWPAFPSPAVDDVAAVGVAAAGVPGAAVSSPFRFFAAFAFFSA